MELHANPTYAFISTTSTTYHPENPLENAIIDNPGLVRRRRRKTSARELEVLEMAFRENEKPSKEVRDNIARQTGMDGKAVQIWFQNKRQSSRRLPKPLVINKGPFAPLKPATIEPSKSSVSNIQNLTNSGIRVPLSTKTNHAPLSPVTKNIQKPSLETTCMSSCAPRRVPLKRTPSIRLGEGIGGRATVVFEETEEPAPKTEIQQPSTLPAKRKVSSKSSRVKKIRREDPGKENIPPVNMSVRRRPREPRSADLEEIALGLVALRDGR